MSCFSQTYLRTSEAFVYRRINSILLGTNTSPGLSWDAMLKMTKVELELLSDYDMLLIIMKWIRGGMSMISN